MINYYAPIVYTNAMGLSRNLSLILGGCTVGILDSISVK